MSFNRIIFFRDDLGAEIADFNITATSFPTYDIRIYTGGCYFFNESSEEWEGGGLEVDAGGDNIWSSCSTLHLSSFGTGFFPTPNKVNFEFISSDFDLEDNVRKVEGFKYHLCLGDNIHGSVGFCCNVFHHPHLGHYERQERY